MNELTIVVHRLDQLEDATVRAVHWQDPMAIFRETPERQPFVYGDWLRAMWTGGTGFIWIEQDVVPPDGSIQAMRDCPEPWCTHGHWTGDRHDPQTFGFVKFSAGFCQNFPRLADIVCTPPDPRYWVRRGWTNLDRRVPPSVLNGAGRRACLRVDAPAMYAANDPSKRPTSHGWLSLDTTMARALTSLGFEPHVHEPPHEHLHDYQARPAGSSKHWFELPYDAIDWPPD